jgi:hypothetical protein
MQRRPVHTDALGYLHHIRAIQHRTNRPPASQVLPALSLS